MIASALAEQPNWKSSSGTPPTAPCSITQVTSPWRPSSSNTRGTWAEMPKPRFTAQPARSSRPPPPGDHLVDAPGRAPEAALGAEILTADGGIVGGLGGLHLVGCDHDRVDQHARHVDRERLERAGLGQPLDLGNDDPAIVAHRQRLIEWAEISALVLVGEVAALVGGGGADDCDVGDNGRKEQPGVAGELD